MASESKSVSASAPPNPPPPIVVNGLATIYTKTLKGFVYTFRVDLKTCTVTDLLDMVAAAGHIHK